MAILQLHRKVFEHGARHTRSLTCVIPSEYKLLTNTPGETTGLK